MFPLAQSNRLVARSHTGLTRLKIVRSPDRHRSEPHWSKPNGFSLSPGAYSFSCAFGATVGATIVGILRFLPPDRCNAVLRAFGATCRSPIWSKPNGFSLSPGAYSFSRASVSRYCIWQPRLNRKGRQVSPRYCSHFRAALRLG